MILKVKLTRRATREVRTISVWWRANRLLAPHLFEKELDAALEWLAASPESGQVYEVPGGRAVRRTLLRRSRYHVYYELDVATDELRVLSVWHASRRGVKLGMN